MLKKNYDISSRGEITSKKSSSFLRGPRVVTELQYSQLGPHFLKWQYSELGWNILTLGWNISEDWILFTIGLKYLWRSCWSQWVFIFWRSNFTICALIFWSSNIQYRGSPTYTKITNSVSTSAIFGLCTCKWGN